MIKKYMHQLITGLSFGLTSGVITALGMIVGLNSATSSRLAVIAGIIILAIVDGLSDAAGVHISEESELEKGEVKHTHKEVWAATMFTFISKFCFTITFAVPVLFFPLETAVVVAVGWGILLLIFLNFSIARLKHENSLKLIFEHVLLAIFVIFASHQVGHFVANWIG